MISGRILKTLESARSEGKAAFIPYITAGDPSLEWTARYVDALDAAGAHVVELGVPFSDPIADGPVNQKAAERALAAGTNLSSILDMVKGLRDRGQTIPIVLFTYFNPLLQMGLNAFMTRARTSGVDGALVVDLPPEEAATYLTIARTEGLETVFLASPTTSDRRLRLIDNASTGFVYYISRLGVTGERTALPETLQGEIARLREFIKKPLAVGFGISTPEQAAAVGRWADAAVVGSALVRIIAENTPAEAQRLLLEKGTALAAALKEGD